MPRRSPPHDLPDPSGDAAAHRTRLSAEQRREQIIEIAIQLFSARGFSGVTTREIAAKAGVTEAIIFRHFETKEQLYRAVIDSVLDFSKMPEFEQYVKEAMDREDDVAVIRRLICGVIGSHKKYPLLERLMSYAALEKNEAALRYVQELFAPVAETFRQYFAKRQKQGHLRPVGADAALFAIAGMAKHYAQSRYVHGIDDCSMTDEEAVETFTQIALSGLILPPAPKTKQTRK